MTLDDDWTLIGQFSPMMVGGAPHSRLAFSKGVFYNPQSTIPPLALVCC